MTSNVRSIHRVYWRRAWRLSVAVVVAVLALMGVLGAQAVSSPHLGYGFNVATVDWSTVQSLGFDWIKIFSPLGTSLPLHVLMRVEANAGNLADLTAFGNSVNQLASVNKGLIHAYEIGNEVNLDANYGWNAPPSPTDYKNLLCTAYTNIKAADPKATVVSAGLAPVGRVLTVPGNPDGSNGQFQDERKYLQQLIAAGGGNCLDAVGLHPYGFSADYNAAPDVVSSDPTQNCDQGLCFRTAEKFYDVMQANGLGNKQVWTTEFGWLLTPTLACQNDPSFAGRQWQFVLPDKQASNLVGAYQYADDNYPWMGPMFIFNLNFDTSPGVTNPCDQMNFYSVDRNPLAMTALSETIKNPVQGRLTADNSSLSWLIEQDWQPLTQTRVINLGNIGWANFKYTVTVDTNAPLAPSVISPTGKVRITGPTAVTVVMTSTARAVGMYTGSLTIWGSPGTAGAPITIPLQLEVAVQVYQVYLPLVMRNSQ
jgi:hypothetical protein